MRNLSEYDKKRLRKGKLFMVVFSIFSIFGVYSIISFIKSNNLEGLGGALLYTLPNALWLFLEVRKSIKILEGTEFDDLEDWEKDLLDEDKDI